MALTQSVVLLHGACCLQDQLLSWACSAPATRSNSDGGMDPHEEVLGVSEATLLVSSSKSQSFGLLKAAWLQISPPSAAVPEQAWGD